MRARESRTTLAMVAGAGLACLTILLGLASMGCPQAFAQDPIKLEKCTSSGNNCPSCATTNNTLYCGYTPPQGWIGGFCAPDPNGGRCTDTSVGCSSNSNIFTGYNCANPAQLINTNGCTTTITYCSNTAPPNP